MMMMMIVGKSTLENTVVGAVGHPKEGFFFFPKNVSSF
jgi:hypothetical protein